MLRFDASPLYESPPGTLGLAVRARGTVVVSTPTTDFTQDTTRKFTLKTSLLPTEVAQALGVRP